MLDIDCDRLVRLTRSIPLGERMSYAEGTSSVASAGRRDTRVPACRSSVRGGVFGGWGWWGRCWRGAGALDAGEQGHGEVACVASCECRNWASARLDDERNLAVPAIERRFRSCRARHRGRGRRDWRAYRCREHRGHGAMDARVAEVTGMSDTPLRVIYGRP